MTAGTTIPSTNISLNTIRSTQEYEILQSASSSSLTTCSTRLLATRPYTGSTNVELDNATPHAMSEFNGYKAPWPELSSNTTYNKVSLFNSSISNNNWVLSATGWEFSMTRSSVNNVDTISFYADHTTGTYMGVAKDSGSFTTVTTLGDVKLGEVTYLNSTSRPDSYYIKYSAGLWSGGFPLQLNSSTGNGSQSFGMNPPNTVYTFYSNPLYYFPTGVSFNVMANDECGSYSVDRSNTLSVIFKKSGYADREVFSLTFTEELEGIWNASLCL